MRAFSIATIALCLMSTACTQTETDGIENAAGALHKARPAVKPSAAALPAVKPAEVKNLDRAFDIEESKPAEVKNLDRAKTRPVAPTAGGRRMPMPPKTPTREQ